MSKPLTPLELKDLLEVTKLLESAPCPPTHTPGLSCKEIKELLAVRQHINIDGSKKASIQRLDCGAHKFREDSVSGKSAARPL